MPFRTTGGMVYGFQAIFEVAYSQVGYMPELMDKLPNHFLEICPEYEELKDMIEVCILEEGSRLYYDMESEQAVLQI
ncbi:MAG: hypothetical protein SPK14_10050 [Lachnospiraceae bacterium]|nr:hypothetical protein [Lachnospiraceae bacterium]